MSIDLPMSLFASLIPLLLFTIIIGKHNLLPVQNVNLHVGHESGPDLINF